MYRIGDAIVIYTVDHLIIKMNQITIQRLKKLYNFSKLQLHSVNNNNTKSGTQYYILHQKAKVYTHDYNHTTIMCASLWLQQFNPFFLMFPMP